MSPRTKVAGRSVQAFAQSAPVADPVAPARMYLIVPEAGGSVTTIAVKIAVTVVLAVKVTGQVPVLEHPPPDQPEKVEPESGVVVKVIVVPEEEVCEQVLPQLIEPPETVPVPVPDLDIIRV